LDVQPYDLLIEKSGGSPDQPVGRAALLEPHHFENGPLCFSNFLSKIRIDTTIIDPTFLFLWLQASHRIGITQSMQSQTNGIRNLIFDEYLDQDIPMPSIAKQIAIRDRVLHLQAETKKLFHQANTELEKAKREIEAMILGEATNE
jgi:restriction endonuclease S subunit